MKTFSIYAAKYLIDSNTRTFVNSIKEFEKKYSLKEKSMCLNTCEFEIQYSSTISRFKKFLKNTPRKEIEKQFFEFNKSEIPADFTLDISIDAGYLAGAGFLGYYARKGQQIVFYLSIDLNTSTVIITIRDEKYRKFILEFADYIFDYVENNT